MTVFADAFALIAWLNSRDNAHGLVTAYLDAFIGRLVTTEWVLMELADEALGLLHEVYLRFRRSYRSMLGALGTVNRPTVVCTVYNAIPGLGPADQVALATFNEIILHEAFLAQFPIIDLRLVCDRPSDYSHVSAIEPSMEGGSKIARVIVEVATKYDFDQGRSVIFT